jgi:hypothetical protein
MSTQSPPGGSIIGISSISALVGGAQQGHYTPTKAGVLSLIQSCACALGKYNIRCNALLPGTIKTQLNEKDLEDDEKRKYMEGRIPLGRTGITRDLAGPAVFLGSEELSGYVVSIMKFLRGAFVIKLTIDRPEHSYWSTVVCLSTYSERKYKAEYNFQHSIIIVLSTISSDQDALLRNNFFNPPLPFKINKLLGYDAATCLDLATHNVIWHHTGMMSLARIS